MDSYSGSGSSGSSSGSIESSSSSYDSPSSSSSYESSSGSYESSSGSMDSSEYSGESYDDCGTSEGSESSGGGESTAEFSSGEYSGQSYDDCGTSGSAESVDPSDGSVEYSGQSYDDIGAEETCEQESEEPADAEDLKANETTDDIETDDLEKENYEDKLSELIQTEDPEQGQEFTDESEELSDREAEFREMTEDEDFASYLADIEEQTGRRLDDEQVKIVTEKWDNNEYSYIGKEATEAHRTEFNNCRKEVIQDWEEHTGQEWPRYEEPLYYNGRQLKPAGGAYDAHHIIENCYDGEHEWWNIHPAKNTIEHQNGIHREGGPINKVFSK